MLSYVDKKNLQLLVIWDSLAGPMSCSSELSKTVFLVVICSDFDKLHFYGVVLCQPTLIRCIARTVAFPG